MFCLIKYDNIFHSYVVSSSDVHIPKARDSVSIVRLIIKRYRGSYTCNGQIQFGNATTHTKIGISNITDSESFALFITDRGMEALEENFN